MKKHFCFESFISVLMFVDEGGAGVKVELSLLSLRSLDGWGDFVFFQE